MDIKESDIPSGPVGVSAAEGSRRRTVRGDAYREARDGYAALEALRQRNPIAAHIRERRYELDLTQQEVAEAASTSHTFISKLEKGAHMPTVSVLKRVLAVLDEELLIGVERQGAGGESEQEFMRVPEHVGMPPE